MRCARQRRAPQDFAAGGTWAQEFAGAGGTGDAWADQFAAGLDGGEWAEQFARDADAGAAAADGVEVDVGAAGEYVFAADNPFMQARRPNCLIRSLNRLERLLMRKRGAAGECACFLWAACVCRRAPFPRQVAAQLDHSGCFMHHRLELSGVALMSSACGTSPVQAGGLSHWAAARACAAAARTAGNLAGVFHSARLPAAQDAGSFARGRELFRGGLLTEAVLAVEAEVQRQPGNVPAWLLLGTIHAENDDDLQVRPAAPAAAPAGASGVPLDGARSLHVKWAL
jgi:hypothetical protein